MPTDCRQGASPWYEDGRVRCADAATDCHYQHATMLVYARDGYPRTNRSVPTVSRVRTADPTG